MENRITVRVIRRRARQHYALRWSGGERIAKAKWGDESAAYREAFQLEGELNAKARSVLSWSRASEAYEEWHLTMFSPDHLKNWMKAKRRFEAFCGDVPELHLLWPKVTQFASMLTSEVSMTTVRGYCQYLRSFLRWCYDQGWLDQPPRRLALPKHKRGDKRGKGRPLVAEEFDRFLAAIPSIVGEKHADSWRFLCEGLWHSSLRLGEAVRLHWTEGPIQLDLSGKRPMIRFAIEGDKGRRERRLAVTKEFHAMLDGRSRHGFIFRPTLSKGVTRSRDTWSHTIGDFGEKAGIIVDRNDRRGTVKYASAHDLRRSCLDRMRGKLSDLHFRLFARHEDDRTSEQYYLGDHADAVAEAIWESR